MKEKKAYTLLCVICWLGTTACGALLAYMMRAVSRFPENETFARNARLAGVMFLVWLLISVWMTVRTALIGRKKK